MIQNYINHVVFVIDRSGSMSGLSDNVVKVFDSQIKYLATRSVELKQETRVSVYLFSEKTECLIYDMDVLRLPSLSSYYQAGGGTALIDATLKAIEDLQKTPELYGDHAFLVYVLTDGQENQSRSTASAIANKINTLPNNYTLAVMVPDQTGIYEAKKFGFSANNIQTWDVSNKGLSDAGETIKKVTDNYLRARATGVRGTKNLFNIDVSNLKTSVIKNNLDELKASEYEILPVRQDAVIKDYVEKFTKRGFVQGSAYYELSKKEIVQANKQIAIQNKLNGKVYTGLGARQLLGLPSQEVKVAPTDFGEYQIYIQSNSTNRKLIKGTSLLVMK